MTVSEELHFSPALPQCPAFVLGKKSILEIIHQQQKSFHHLTMCSVYGYLLFIVCIQFLAFSSAISSFSHISHIPVRQWLCIATVIILMIFILKN